MSYIPLAMLNQNYILFDGVPGDAAESEVVALPARCTTISWQTSFGTEPASYDIALMASLDGVNFVEVDDADVVDGEIRTVQGNFTHLRADIVAVVDGADVTVSFVPKDL